MENEEKRDRAVKRIKAIHQMNVDTHKRKMRHNINWKLSTKRAFHTFIRKTKCEFPVCRA